MNIKDDLNYTLTGVEIKKMIGSKWNYEEVEKEKVILLIVPIVKELSSQNKIKIFEDEILLRDWEIANIVEDKLSSLDDEQYKEFLNKLTNVLMDM